MPVNSSLPNKSTYGATEILAPNVSWWNNRSEYLSETGKQAPAFVAGQPVKRWAVAGLNPNDSAGQYTFNYLGLDSTGNAAMLSMTIPASVAASVNLPGTVSYQPYSAWVAGRMPTKGTVEYKFFGTDLINPMDVSMLFTPDEANALAAQLSAQLGATFTAVPLTTPDGNATATYHYDPADPRRIYDIMVTVPTDPVTATKPQSDQMFAMGGPSGLFAIRSSVGVGAPGAWSWTLNVNPKSKTDWNYAGGPRWTAAVQADGATEAREYPVPVRALVSPPEKLAALLGNVVVVERTDLLPQAASGGLTDAQASALLDIQAKVSALWRTLPPAAQ